MDYKRYLFIMKAYEESVRSAGKLNYIFASSLRKWHIICVAQRKNGANYVNEKRNSGTIFVSLRRH